jgi:hypothetical protein
MIRSLFSALGMIIRPLLVLVAFVVYRGSQPMQQDGAIGMTYWQFMRERIGAIRELPAKCQRMHFTSFAIAVQLYPALYTYIGIYPESYLARHTQPDPLILKDIGWVDVPDTWWRLVEDVSWEAWITQHLPTVMPECNLTPPQS